MSSDFCSRINLCPFSLGTQLTLSKLYIFRAARISTLQPCVIVLDRSNSASFRDTEELFSSTPQVSGQEAEAVVTERVHAADSEANRETFTQLLVPGTTQYSEVQVEKRHSVLGSSASGVAVAHKVAQTSDCSEHSSQKAWLRVQRGQGIRGLSNATESNAKVTTETPNQRNLPKSLCFSSECVEVDSVSQAVDIEPWCRDEEARLNAWACQCHFIAKEDDALREFCPLSPPSPSLCFTFTPASLSLCRGNTPQACCSPIDSELQIVFDARDQSSL